MEITGSSETVVNLYHTFIIILVLQPGSHLDHPCETSPCHSVCCLDFQLLIPLFQLIGIYSCWFVSCHSVQRASLGVFWKELFYRMKEWASCRTTDWWIRPLHLCSQRQCGPAILPTLGVYFSHFLWQAWTMLGLFLFPATTWGMYYTIQCHISTVTTVRTSSFQRGHLTYFYTGVIL